MAQQDYKPNDEVSMETGDVWYFDEFGEYRNSNINQPEQEDPEQDSIAPDELENAPDTAKGNIAGDMLADEEFNETLKSEYINDQLGDPMLREEAEADYRERME